MSGVELMRDTQFEGASCSNSRWLATTPIADYGLLSSPRKD